MERGGCCLCLTRREDYLNPFLINKCVCPKSKQLIINLDYLSFSYCFLIFYEICLVFDWGHDTDHLVYRIGHRVGLFSPSYFFGKVVLEIFFFLGGKGVGYWLGFTSQWFYRISVGDLEL